MAWRLKGEWIGNKPTDMAPFAATVNARMYSSQEGRRCKTTTVRIIVTDTAFILCRDMIRRLAYGTKQHIIGIAIMAAFTVVSDARVNEALCRFERRSCDVAHITILLCR